MKRILSMFVLTAFIFGSLTQMQAQTSKAAEKEEKKEERREKRAARLAKDSIMGEAAFNNAMQAITNQSFVLEATSVQPLNGRVYFVNSNTNFVSLNDGQAMVQIASNSPYPGPNGLGGITVQGTASNIEVKQEKNGNVYVSMSVQGVFLSATVNLVLYSGNNNAMVTVDPNFSGNDLRMNGTLIPYSESNVFQGMTY
ncbi:MAG: DUF4251 domain-containing protein [Parabacteroides distasonis]|nr:DUF4251 domain-containing protein [Parabacteroides distasonis]MBQ4162264.1 DUF4251 domain-containing protein [Parabacteroides sp.]MBR2497276.1 DUF4251 domain-containing protein [Parabacteroides sp.]